MILAKSVEDWKQEVVSNKDLIFQQLQQYIPIETLEEISGPLWNSLFCGKGKETKYCVKVLNEESIPVDWTIEELDYIGKAMFALRSADFTYVLPPLPLQDGFYASRLANYSVTVYPWFEAFGQNEANSTQTPLLTYISAASTVLHELHLKGRVVAETLGELSSAFPRKYTPYKWVNVAASLWEECDRSMSQMGASQEVFSALHDARQKSNEIVSDFPEFFSSSPEEKTIVHGDFRPENILIQNNCVQLVYDFDFMRVGIAEEDIAYSALYCSGSSWFSGSRDWKICADFIGSYQQSAIAKSHSAIKTSLLEAALYWTILKELSLSFTPEAVIGRYQILNELKDNINWILASTKRDKQQQFSL